MATSDKQPANGFVRVARKVYNPIGFSKGYNFVLWFIFAGALMGFTLAKLEYLNYYGKFCGPNISATSHAAPGECYYYLKGDYETVGMIMHLGCILPATFLLFFQFIPAIRHKVILFHRVNGYIILILAVTATVGALMITRHAFGGGMDTQMAFGFIAIIFLGSLVMAYINIKRLQIEQHRAWMLRAWFYAASIISLRIIQALAGLIISTMSDYFTARPCGQILDTFRGNMSTTLQRYPECEPFASGENLNQYAVVKANLIGGTGIESAAALGMNFGAAAWLALALHAIGIEIYLKLTPKETERLRNVSYQRQLEAGMTNPGRAGLTIDRFGDSEKWAHQSERNQDINRRLET